MKGELAVNVIAWVVIAGTVGVMLIPRYVIMPLRIRRTQVRELHSRHQLVEWSELPAEVASSFTLASRWLVGCGFQSVGIGSHLSPYTKQSAFVAVWCNPVCEDVAECILVRTPTRVGVPKIISVVTIRTEFEDGTALLTTNSPSQSVYPADTRLSIVRCPQIDDLNLLHRFHRARVTRDTGGRKATLEWGKDPAARMQRQHSETFDRLSRAGYYALDEANQRYVPTFKGAFLMTYRMLTPFKQLQEAAGSLRANRALRELGFGGITEFRRSQALIPPTNTTVRPAEPLPE